MHITLPRHHWPFPTRAAALLRRWWRWRVERWELLAMSERELRDIGLTRTDARALASRSLWRR